MCFPVEFDVYQHRYPEWGGTFQATNMPRSIVNPLTDQYRFGGLAAASPEPMPMASQPLLYRGAALEELDVAWRKNGGKNTDKMSVYPTFCLPASGSRDRFQAFKAFFRRKSTPGVSLFAS